MFNWFFSRPLQIKFFFSSILVVGIGLLLLMLSVFQVLNQFLSHYTEQDMEQRTHILAMAMMSGPAAHNQNDLYQLLQEVSDMHGYCYLSVYDTAGKLLASAGSGAPLHKALPGAILMSPRKACLDGEISLVHDGKPFGTLHYGADANFIDALELNLRTKFIIFALLWFSIGSTVYFFLVRRLVKPLKAITRASESMAHGNLSTAMPKDLPQDELGKLAFSLNNMATALRERIESQQSYAHALYVEQARLNALVSILPVGIFFVDPNRHVQFINLECRHLWGLSESDVYIGQLDVELIAYANSKLVHPDDFTQNVEAALKVYGITASFDTPLRNGHIIRSRSCVVPDATGDRYIGRIWMFEDVTIEQTRLSEAQARAERDALTGLYNRRRFEEDLEQLFAQAQRNDHRLTLLYFDLDDFKNINDDYGHSAGDKVLNAVAKTLVVQSRRNENLYRVGGDEFAILISDAELHQIEILAQRVASSIERLQFSFAEQQVQIRCSIGITSCSPDVHPDNALELLQQADAAMYQAKHFGKNRWHIYDPQHPLDLGRDSR